MAQLGLKVFYLRTRERGMTQQAVADAMNVRQATLSNIERGSSYPSAAMLLELSRFYDVTPTYLLDDERGVVPLPTERWSMRGGLVTAGMWVEVPRDKVVDLANGNVMCPLQSGQRFFDAEAADAMIHSHASSPVEPTALENLVATRREADDALVEVLANEMQVHPRRRGRT